MRNITSLFPFVVLLALCLQVSESSSWGGDMKIGAEKAFEETLVHGGLVDSGEFRQPWDVQKTPTNHSRNLNQKNWRQRRERNRQRNINNKWKKNSNNKCQSWCRNHHTPWCVKRKWDGTIKGKCAFDGCKGCNKCLSDPCANQKPTNAYNSLPEASHSLACPENEATHHDRIHSLRFFDDDIELESSDLDCSCCPQTYGYWYQYSNTPCCVPYGSG